MNFEDATLVRLADPNERRSIFDELSLQHILEAAVDTSGITLEGPYDATFDEMRLGVSATPVIKAEGGWSDFSQTERVVARFDVAWPPGPDQLHADLMWHGTVIARAAAPSGVVDAIGADWPDIASLDDDIALLPAEPAELEAARRRVLLARLRAGAAQPDAISDRLVDGLLESTGVASVGELADRHAGDLATGLIRIHFAERPAPPPMPRQFLVDVALLVRAGVDRLADLFAVSAAMRSALGPELSYPQERDHARRGPVVAWVVPAETFDDEDWPGAEPGQAAEAARLARRTAAAAWLAPAGIALVPVLPAA
ncbi:hypothetical protein [Actinomycetospora straminea]|uniref:Uncharacterized protein n=1 Tax=Actinomycetospora straminea TaxID=663607 RepID=A0ABP9EII6_9PSEU|nr:hypothetical protein [Actinomycetospora straminea]MDD7933727.1 hypothetical protein [Actinomycetospora straminea]